MKAVVLGPSVRWIEICLVSLPVVPTEGSSGMVVVLKLQHYLNPLPDGWSQA